MSYKVSPKRHVAKTISYRIISTLIGFFAMWWATGDIRFGTAFGFIELDLNNRIEMEESKKS